MQVLVVDENERNKLEWNLGGEVARRISKERERQGEWGVMGNSFRGLFCVAVFVVLFLFKVEKHLDNGVKFMFGNQIECFEATENPELINNIK